jgi:hypothetical protein
VSFSAVSISSSQSDSITEILDEYVDPFFVDSADATIQTPTGALCGVFKADFFGECRITKQAMGNLRGDLWVMANVANEFFERRMTECASHGTVAAKDRPVIIPDGFHLEFIPSEE